jgi:hypothetical protein
VGILPGGGFQSKVMTGRDARSSGQDGLQGDSPTRATDYRWITHKPAHFSIGQSGSVVICHHQDSAETWLPTDLGLR